MKYIDIQLGTEIFRAHLLEDRSPHTTRALWNLLPIETQVVHGHWSRSLIHTLEPTPIYLEQSDPPAGFQHPGLMVYEPSLRILAICYGQGQLLSPTHRLAPIPVAEIGGSLAQLTSFGLDIQFSGAQPVAIRASEDQRSPLADSFSPNGQKVEVRLADTVVTATLLEEVAPTLASSFASLLPLTGRASNTVSGGPLTRFWSDSGGREGETPLQTDGTEPSQRILYPGYIYYLPNPPWRGLRIPGEATAMGGANSNPSPKLIPLAKFNGDWSAFKNQAGRIRTEGAKSLSFHNSE